VSDPGSGLATIVQLLLEQVRRFGLEFEALLKDPRVWLSMIEAIVAGAACLAIGIWVTRRVGILGTSAPIGETIGVGLGSGLVLVASIWAAVASGGRSGFTPVAFAFVLSILIAVRRPERDSGDVEHGTAPVIPGGRQEERLSPHVANGIAAAAAFVALVGLLYGATIAPSPRDGQQPVEFHDQPFYAVLGRDLAQSGTESIYSPSGFADLPGLPAQTWYHWGDIWLSAASMSIFGVEPMLARHYIVLPLILLAAAALTGTLVRRARRTRSPWAFLMGFWACLFLAPIPMLGTFFSSWPTGLIYGITTYGLAAVPVLLVLYLIVTRKLGPPKLATSIFTGAVVASVIPSHIVIAFLGLVGIGAAAIPWLARTLMRRPWSLTFPDGTGPTVVISAVTVAATVAWGLVTGHGIGVSGLADRVSPFNVTWQLSVALWIVGAGVFLAIPIELFLARRHAGVVRPILLGTTTLLVVGALIWGARLGDFTMFYFFYGGIAIIGTPVAAIAIWSLWERAKLHGRRRPLAIAVFVVCVLQLEFGVVAGILRLEQTGGRAYEPLSLELVASARALPVDAKIAYACNEFEELAFWNAKLMSLDAHGGRHLVPMCFETDLFSALEGVDVSGEFPSPLFRTAPQRALYPNRESRPTPAAVLSFLKDHQIEYIYADSAHPNSLVPEAVPIATGGSAELLRIP
jgi:hypothetical protein